MFTGIVEEAGRVVSIEAREGGVTLWVEGQVVPEDFRPGDSLAVNGCCLTVVEVRGNRLKMELVPETLSRTSLGEARPGSRVNLERAMRAEQRVGGHFVQGHVDGVGVVTAMVPEGNGMRLTVRLPEGLLPYVAEKGSVALDGVSLTVAAVHGDEAEVALIPHTLEITVAGEYAPGRRVNVEVDLLARYLARLIETSAAPGLGRTT
jgi:riboflavin synthase